MSQCHVGRRGVETMNVWLMSWRLLQRSGAGGGLATPFSGIYPEIEVYDRKVMI